MKLNREKLHYAAQYLAWVAGGKSVVPLRVRNVVHSLLLRMKYDWAVVGGTGAGAVAGQASHRVLGEYRMRGNDDDLQVFSGPFIYFYNLLFGRQLLPQTPPTSVAAGAAEAGRVSLIALPFVMGHSSSPDEWGLPPLRDPSVTFTWANPKELVTSAQDGAPAFSNVALELFERWYEDMQPPAGGFSPLLTKQWERAVLQDGKLPITLEGLMSGPNNGPGHELRALFIEGLADGVAGAQFAHNNSVITSLRLVGSGGKPWQELIDFDVIQAENVGEYQLAATQTGLAVLDSAAHDKNTRVGQLWTITGRETPVLELDCKVQGIKQNRVRVTAVYTAGRYAKR